MKRSGLGLACLIQIKKSGGRKCNPAAAPHCYSRRKRVQAFRQEKMRGSFRSEGGRLALL